MTTVPAPVPEAQAPVSHFGRILGVFFGPTKTFEEIAKRPTWLLPLVILMLLGTGVGFQLAHRVNWEQVIGQKIDASPQAAQLSAAQREQRIALGARISRDFCYGAGVLGSPITLLIFAALYLGAFNIMANAGLRFGQSLGIVAHAMMPTLISSALAIVVLALKDPSTVDPNHLLATDIYAFLPGDAPQWLQSLGSSIELFFTWMLVLVSIGFAAANPRKVTRGKAFGIVFGLWGIWVLGKVIWALS
ncbi:MAG: YIP1 family protein [Candidatus Acidiferrales bacterium]